MIFNLPVFFRVGLNGFPLTYSCNYMMVYMCSALRLILSARLFFFLLTSYQLSLFADWSTLPRHTQDQTISASLQRSKLHTQKAYGFSVPGLTPADTFRLGPSDGATTVSCFDLCHSGDAMFVKVINKICVGTVLNNKSQISR